MKDNLEKDIIKEITSETSSNEKTKKESFNYYDKNIKKNKYYKELEKEVDEYMRNTPTEEPSRGLNLNNIHKPFLKLVLVFFIGMLIVNYFSSKYTGYPEITGLWGDDKGNYYEIYGKTFEMNAGKSDTPFFIGEITNLVELETGYIILVKGVKYNLNNDGTTSYDKQMELTLKITNYTPELQTIMTANMGTNDYEIIRLENTPKPERIDKQ